MLKGPGQLRRCACICLATVCTLLALVLFASRAFADDLADHWSFRPVEAVPPPSSGDAWVRDPVDAFVIAKLRAVQLEPSAQTDRRALVRRAHFVLHGLPPSPETVEKALRDPREDWYERLVDDLLRSPRYGERFARHWLDTVRYAESNGFETNRPRKTAYHYRDYVIRAFNEDLAYDRFVVEQLAGDALGEDAATGFLVAGPYDLVKSPDKELTLMQRADELADIVNATSSTFLGLSVACARCHSHKFDPVSHTDYYAMVAVFAGVQYGERGLARRQSDDDRRRAEELAGSIAALRSELRELGVREPVNAKRNVEEFEAARAKLVRFTILETNASEPCIDELEIWSAAGAGTPRGIPQNVALAVAGAKARASGTLPGFSIHRLEHINDGKYGNSRSWISSTRGGWVEIELPRTSRIDRIEWGRDRDEKYRDRVATRYRIEIAVKPGEWRTIVSSASRLPFGTSIENLSAAPPGKLTEEQAVRVEGVATKLRLAEEERTRLTAREEKVWAGTFRQPEPTHRLFRGNPTKPREVVFPDTLESFGSLPVASDAPEQARRLALARWIASTENPFAARVMANRLWQWIFGEGIVSTPNDLGTNGASPTHPELLDYLAGELTRGGWSVKSIVRRLVLSSTFRQASVPRAAALRVDGGNRLLWRFAPRRLEAEAIRDSVLSTSGVLDLRLGGPGFDVVVAQPGNVYNYVTKTKFGPADWRRSIYGHQIRGEQDATFGVFDCPDGGQIVPRRARSTTALQALNLLNSPFVMEQAGLFAGRLRREASDVDAQVALAFRLAFQRDPQAGEREDASQLVRAHGLEALARALFNSNELLFME